MNESAINPKLGRNLTIDLSVKKLGCGKRVALGDSVKLGAVRAPAQHFGVWRDAPSTRQTIPRWYYLPRLRRRRRSPAAWRVSSRRAK